MMRSILALLCAGSFAAGAFASPPDNADPALAPWFRSLQQPTTGIGCCSQADCRAVESRIDGKTGLWMVLIGAQFQESKMPPVTPHWMEVAPAHVLRRENPVGRGVACWRRTLINGWLESDGEVLCFIPPPEA